MSLPLVTMIAKNQPLFLWSTRDIGNRSWVVGATGSFDNGRLTIDWDTRFVALRPGVKGAFDSDGVSGSDVEVNTDGSISLYYFGWQRLEDSSWLNGIGVASGPIGDELERVSNGPILSRDIQDPFSVAYPFLSRTSDSELLYSTYVEYADPRITQSFKYVVKKSSMSSATWRLEDRSQIALEEILGASAYSRPTIFRHENREVLLCSVRGLKYEIRGWVMGDIGWERRGCYDGHPLRGPSSCESTCYQFPFFQDEDCFLLYNGDNYGLSGFGLARWVM